MNLWLKTLAGEGIVFDEILIDGSMPGDGSPRRKPGIGMVEKYLNEWDWSGELLRDWRSVDGYAVGG